MPEGHSIHRIARQIGDVFTGERVQVSSPRAATLRVPPCWMGTPSPGVRAR